MRDHFQFFLRFLRNPRKVGSVMPSSPQLVRDLLDGVDFEAARVVVEFGPGTGVFSSEIVKRLHPEAHLVCIELNDEFFHTMCSRFKDPRVKVIHGSAADVQTILEQLGLDRADAIVSGLPFTTLPEQIRHEILRGTVSALKPKGRFLLYQYSLFLMNHLRHYFEQIQLRRTILNLPPAYTFYCDAPRGTDTVYPA